MTVFSFILTFLSAGLMFFAIYYFFHVIYVHKTLFNRYTLFVLLCFTASMYLVTQMLLSLDFNHVIYLYLHRVKLLFLYLHIPFQLLTIYIFFLPEAKKTIPYILSVVVVLLLILLPTDMVVSYPVEELIVETSIADFVYHYGQTNLGYTFFSIAMIIALFASLILFSIIKTKKKRIPFVIIIISLILVSANDFSVTHNFYSNIMLGEYYIFIVIAFVYLEILRADRKSYLKIMKLNQKMKSLDAAKNYFIGLLTHELNTPLMGINGNAQIISELTNDEDIKDCVNEILESERRLRKFSELSLLITCIRTEKYHLNYVNQDLIELFEQVLLKFDTGLKMKHLNVLKDFSIKKFYKRFDPALLEKVFGLIIENAIKYSPENTTLTFKTHKIKKKLIIEIIDQGPGFSPKVLENMFQFFSSTDDLLNHNEGKGLGLAVSKMIMEMHNFELHVDNAFTGGASIKMVF